MNSARPQLRQLDLLRGLSALAVVFYHVHFRFPGRELPVIRNGALFVDLFFVLSGFIMLHSYRTIPTSAELLRFLGLRLFRIYPLHLVMLGVFLAYELGQYVLVTHGGLSTQSAPFETNNGYALMLGLTLLNGVGLYRLSFNGPSWSISTEFWTYLVFGVTLSVLGSRPARLAIAFALFTASALIVVASQPTPSLTQEFKLFLPRCVYGFFLGALLRLALPREARLQRSRPWLGTGAQAASVAISVTLICVTNNATRWLELLVPLSFTLVIASFVYWPETKLIRLIDVRPLQWLGARSYSIYMVHALLVLLIQALVRIAFHVPYERGVLEVSPLLGLLLLAVYLTATLALASLTYRFIEEPGRLYGRRLLRATPHRDRPLVTWAAAEPRAGYAGAHASSDAQRPHD